MGGEGSVMSCRLIDSTHIKARVFDQTGPTFGQCQGTDMALAQEILHFGVWHYMCYVLAKCTLCNALKSAGYSTKM